PSSRPLSRSSSARCSGSSPRSETLLSTSPRLTAEIATPPAIASATSAPLGQQLVDHRPIRRLELREQSAALFGDGPVGTETEGSVRLGAQQQTCSRLDSELGPDGRGKH